MAINGLAPCGLKVRTPSDRSLSARSKCHRRSSSGRCGSAILRNVWCSESPLALSEVRVWHCRNLIENKLRQVWIISERRIAFMLRAEPGTKSTLPAAKTVENIRNIVRWRWPAGLCRSPGPGLGGMPRVNLTGGAMEEWHIQHQAQPTSSDVQSFRLGDIPYLLLDVYNGLEYRVCKIALAVDRL